MKIREVPTSLVPDLWPAAGPMLGRALKLHPFLTPKELLRVLLSGKGALILAIEGERIICAAVMEALEFENDTVGNIIALAGDQGVYRTHMDTITDHLESWCAKHACNKIAMTGRDGWRRFVERRGWSTQPRLAAWKDISGRSG